MVCPIIDILQILGKRWTLCILHIASQGEVRFNELSRQLGVNPRTLSDRLTELVKYGLLERKSESYELTKKGKDLISSFSQIDDWAKRYSITDSAKC
jgi:DNA-binding HxlR family transcriptional regulator